MRGESEREENYHIPNTKSHFMSNEVAFVFYCPVCCVVQRNKQDTIEKSLLVADAVSHFIKSETLASLDGDSLVMVLPRSEDK